MGSKGDNLFSESSDYKRDLGLKEAVSIVIGRIIGSGIFKTPGLIMGGLAGYHSESILVFAVVWVLGGIITAFAAACYAEMVAMMPKSGGPYVYLKAAYHEIVAFLRGWAMFFVSETGAIAAVALFFGENLLEVYNIITGIHLPVLYKEVIALCAVWGLTAINLFGVHLSGLIQNMFSSIKVVVIIFIVSVTFISRTGDFAHFSGSFFPKDFSWETIAAIFITLRYAFFAFSGWEGATYIAEEVKKPRKNLPLSLFLGIGGVVILYLAANISYIYQLPVEAIAGSKLVATDSMKIALGSTGSILITIAIMVNAFGNISTQILCKARSWQAMARDGLFFQQLAPLHKKYKTPNNALLAQAVWASVIILTAGSYKIIIDWFTATGRIFDILTLAALFVLRKKFKDVERPYKAPLYPYSLIFVLVLNFGVLFMALYKTPLESVIGLCLTFTGLLYYNRMKLFSIFYK